MKASRFHFDVPADLIALTPASPRRSAKLMVFDSASKETTHSTFEKLPALLRAGDLLVFNNTFVIPARFFGKRETGGEIEGLLLQASSPQAKVWIKGKVNVGEALNIVGFGKVLVASKDGKEVRLACSRDELAAALKASGSIPIPPYIAAERKRRTGKTEMAEDREQYQSLFAKESEDFSVAAPTASLHFDDELMASLKVRGILSTEITLHVGEGTFAPLEVEDLEKHPMHFEEVRISDEAWQKISETKAKGGRVIAVGTTVCRSLESAARRDSADRAQFSTNLFIKPPFQFKIIDGLITNFHWPDSTLIVLIATFLERNQSGECGPEIKDDWRGIYNQGIQNRYRLFSYGDGMLIL